MARVREGWALAAYRQRQARIYESVVQSGRGRRISGSAAVSEKPSDISHKWRRTRAMASTKVGDGLAYQAAVRWAEGRCCCSRWAARVVQEKSRHQELDVVQGDGPPTTGVGSPRPDALAPPLGRVTSSCQRLTNHSRICVGSTARSVHSKALCGEFGLGQTLNQTTSSGWLHGRACPCDPNRRLRGEFRVRVAPLYQATAAGGPYQTGMVDNEVMVSARDETSRPFRRGRRVAAPG